MRGAVEWVDGGGVETRSFSGSSKESLLTKSSGFNDTVPAARMTAWMN